MRIRLKSGIVHAIRPLYDSYAVVCTGQVFPANQMWDAEYTLDPLTCKKPSCRHAPDDPGQTLKEKMEGDDLLCNCLFEGLQPPCPVHGRI